MGKTFDQQCADLVATAQKIGRWIRMLNMQQAGGMMPDMEIDKTDFSYALFAMKQGERQARLGWNGNGMWVALQPSSKERAMTLPFLYMKTADGHFVPWFASQTDLLAEDWVTVEKTD